MRRVLVVDDSGAARSSLRALVEPFGFTVEEADNGAAALQRLKAAPFELVFVDIHMPVLDGPSLIRMVRAQKIEVRVILITTGAPTSTITSAVRMGVSDYVRKPFDPEQVRVATARALGMEPDALRPAPVRVQVRDLDDDLAQSLQSYLPPHVQLDVAAPAAAIERRALERYAVILLDGSAPWNIAAELRAADPLANLFSIQAGAGPERWWAPDATLDGTLPRDCDASVVRGFLYANFLRPLVFVDGSVFTVAGFDGESGHLPAYLAAVGRALARRCARADATQDLVIDLRQLPPDVPGATALVERVHSLLDASGPVPAFRVARALRERLSAAPELHQIVLFGE